MLSGTFAKYTSEYSGQDTALVAAWNIVAFAGQIPDDDDTPLDIMDSNETKVLALFDHEYDIHMNQKDGESFIIAPGVDGEFVLALGNYSDVAADIIIDIEPLDDNVTVSLGAEEEGEGAKEYQLPIEYSVDGGDSWVTLEQLAENVVAAIVDNYSGFSKGIYESTGVSGNVFRIGARGSVIQNEDDEEDDDGDECRTIQIVQWRWPYEPADSAYNYASDGLDTAFGRNSAEEAEEAENGENGENGERASYGIKITVTATQVAPEVGGEEGAED